MPPIHSPQNGLTQVIAKVRRKNPNLELRWRDRPIPDGVTPLVRKLFEEMNSQQCTDRSMAQRSGLHHTSICDWRHRTIPNVENLNACLNVLGLELTVREIK